MLARASIAALILLCALPSQAGPLPGLESASSAVAVPFIRQTILLSDSSDTWTREIKTPQQLSHPISRTDALNISLLLQDLIDTYEGRELLDLSKPDQLDELKAAAQEIQILCRAPNQTTLVCKTDYEGVDLWNGSLEARFRLSKGKLIRILSLDFDGSM